MKFFSKSDCPVELLKMSKKESCVPTSTLISEFPVRHGCGFFPEEIFPWRPNEASKYRYKLAEVVLSSAFSPRFTCGMRWAVKPSVAPASGLALNLTSVMGFHIGWINMSRVARENYEG